MTRKRRVKESHRTFSPSFLFLGLFVISFSLVSGKSIIDNQIRAIKCAVIDRECIVKFPGTTGAIKLEDEKIFKQIIQSRNNITRLVLTSLSGRVLWESTIDRTNTTVLQAIHADLIRITDHLPSGIYALHTLEEGDPFHPVIGDTTDNVSGVGDLDGDGDDDVVLAGYSTFSVSQPKFFSSNGTGGLVEEPDRIPPVGMRRTVDIVIFDADSDVDLDILFINTDERNRLFINNGSGYFADESSSRFLDGLVLDTSMDGVFIDI